MLSTLYYDYTEKVRYELCLKRWKNGPISLAFSIYVEKKKQLKMSMKIPTMPYLFPYSTLKVKSPIEYNQGLFCNFVDIFSTINLPPGIISIELKLSVLAVAAGAFQLTNDDRTDQSLP